MTTFALCSDSNGTAAYVTSAQIYGKLIADNLGYTFANYSVSGYTAAQIKSCVDTAISNGNDVILMVAGTNDLSQAVSNGTSLETAMNNVTANVELAINAAKAAGKKLIVGSPILPNENYIKGVAFELERRLEALCVRREVDFVPFTGFMQAMNLKLFDATYGAYFTVDKWHMLSGMHALWADFFMSRQIAAAAPPSGPVTLLDMDMNGADGSTAFTDATGRTVTVVGNTQIDTAQSFSGGASALFDGSGDRLTLPDSDDWALGAASFEITMDVRYAALGGFLICQRSGSGDYMLFYNDGTKTYFQVVSGSSILLNAQFSWVPSINTWYSLKLERSGNNFKFYVNGTQQDSTVTSSVSIPNYGAVLSIGGDSFSGGGHFNGWMDNIKIVKN